MRWRDFIEMGIPVIGSTDWPWTTPEGYYDVPLTPFLAIYQAVTRDGYYHLAVKDYQQAQTLTVEQSLRLLTINGTFGTFEEDRKGSLEPGKWATLLVLGYSSESDFGGNAWRSAGYYTIIRGPDDRSLFYVEAFESSSGHYSVEANPVPNPNDFFVRQSGQVGECAE